MTQRITELTEQNVHDDLLRKSSINGKGNLLKIRPFIERDRRSVIADQFIRRCLEGIVVVDSSHTQNETINDKLSINPILMNAVNYVYDDVECLERSTKNLTPFSNGDDSEWIYYLNKLKSVFRYRTVYGIDYGEIFLSRGINLEWEIMDFSQLFNQVGTALNVIYCSGSELDPKNCEAAVKLVRKVKETFDKYKKHSKLEKEHPNIFDRNYFRIEIPDNLNAIAEERVRQPYLKTSIEDTKCQTYEHWKKLMVFRYGRESLLF